MSEVSDRCGEKNGDLVCVRYAGHAGGHFWGTDGMPQDEIEEALFSVMFPTVANPFAAQRNTEMETV